MAGWAHRMLGRAASAVDEALVAGLHRAGESRRAGTMSHADRMERLAEICAIYSDPALIDTFFPPPAPIVPTIRPAGEGIVDLSWTSGFEPWLAELRPDWLAHERNRIAHARMWRGPRPGPVVVVVHGYGGGFSAFSERLWPIGALQARGWDVVLPVLPFHGPRARTQRPWPPPFPAADPRLTNEGFRQAALDLRSLIRWLVDQGHGPVGLMGMSLGGYTVSLLATLVTEVELAFVAPVIPLASIADFARQHGRLGVGAEGDAQHAALEAANAVVSPFARPSRVPPERVHVIACEGDRITGPSHARRLADHFGAEIDCVPGGHVLQVGLRGGYERLIERIVPR